MNFFLFLSDFASNLILLEIVEFIIVLSSIEVEVGLVVEGDGVGLRDLKLICMGVMVLGSISEPSPNSAG